MKRTGLFGFLLFFIVTAVGCSTVTTSGEGLLPEGMEVAQIPGVNVGGYVYFHSEPPVTLANDFFLRPGSLAEDEVERIALDQATIVLGSSVDEFGGLLEFVSLEDALAAWSLFETRVDSEQVWGKLASPQMQLVTGNGEWSEAVKDIYESNQLVSLKEHDPEGWRLLTNLPASPPSQPVAAGILRVDEGLIDSITDRANLEMGEIEDTFGLVRVESLGFAVYTDTPLEFSSRIDRDYIRESGSSMLIVSQSGYPGAVVSFMISVIGDRADMELIELGSTNARYRSIEDMNIIIKNKGSLLYAAVASTRRDAERLMLSALAN